MNAMVNNLLDMARLQSGAVQLRRQWQPFEEVVGSALQALGGARDSDPRGSAGGAAAGAGTAAQVASKGGVLAGHRLQIRLPADLPLVSFDAALIERVLCNLLENAAKYTPPGSQVVIAAQVRAPSLLISVSDDGPGLPPGQEEALFEKFARGERESATPGIGLGLAICRAIIDAHGGRIWVEGGEGAAGRRGARFCFTLPLGVPPAMPASEEPEDGVLADTAARGVAR
jgi:two-component system sensor histidine kinase KdpD